MGKTVVMIFICPLYLVLFEYIFIILALCDDFVKFKRKLDEITTVFQTKMCFRFLFPTERQMGSHAV